jgi:hypothetical protein
MALGQLGDNMSKEVSSPSRTYVAMCNKSNFKGYYFRKFVLPETDPFDIWSEEPAKIDNTCADASWFFLNRLNCEACIECVFPFEQYSDLTDAE